MSHTDASQPAASAPSVDETRATRRVREALAGHGLDHGIRVLPDSTRTAAEAAAALGVEVGAIANSLVFVADGEPILVMTSGAHRVDLARFAAAIGATEVTRADPETVRKATGQTIGGVSPVGHTAPLRTYVDRWLERYPQLWAAAGSPHSVFPVTFEQLVAITGGEIVDVE